MKIIIYLNASYLADLHRFLTEGDPAAGLRINSEWSEARVEKEDIKVIISYDDYVKLLDI